jgi:uncharacterized RDD family membrane protein YckC
LGTVRGMSDAPPPPPPPPSYGATPAAGGWTGQGQLAEWPQRALGGLIDFVAPWIIAGIFIRINLLLGLLVDLAAIVWTFYNAYLNGSTGKSYGKQVVGLKVVREADGQLIGGGLGIVRYLAHIVDSIICYIGFLFPLWDAKKQTLADKIMSTVVLVDQTS